jgi:hypothetical protein
MNVSFEHPLFSVLRNNVARLMGLLFLTFFTVNMKVIYFQRQKIVPIRHLVNFVVLDDS